LYLEDHGSCNAALLLGLVDGYRHDDLFDRYAAVLERILVIIDKVIVIVRITEIIILPCENIAGAYIGLGQEGVFGPAHLEYFFGIVIEVFPGLIP
jgi:hypothetical protein